MSEQTDSLEPTSVTIFGRTYYLRGNEDRGYLNELAAVVDQKMREAAEATGTADTQKVAILASLNLADELLQAGRGVRSTVTPGTPQRLARMVTLLDEALAG